MTGICTLVGAYVITKKVIVPIADAIVTAIDEKTKFTDTAAYAMTKLMKKLNKKEQKNNK